MVTVLIWFCYPSDLVSIFVHVQWYSQKKSDNACSGSVSPAFSQSWLPNGYTLMFRSYVFGPLGLTDYGSATLSCKIGSLPFFGLHPPTRRNPRKRRDQILPSSNTALSVSCSYRILKIPEVGWRNPRCQRDGYVGVISPRHHYEQSILSVWQFSTMIFHLW